MGNKNSTGVFLLDKETGNGNYYLLGGKNIFMDRAGILRVFGTLPGYDDKTAS